MPDFSDTERRLIDLLKVGAKFKFDGVEYVVSAPSCKPTVAKGECKTDVYVQTTSIAGDRIFKISVKQQNADFLENKMSHERAVEIFGSQGRCDCYASHRKHKRKLFEYSNHLF